MSNRYTAMTFIPYQIDHQVANTAKTLGFSKKRVNFKFGFANEEAVERGETGPACRGSEHEVIFVWSLKSGKRHLMLNGKDVHYSESGQNGWTVDRSWQHSFPLRDPSQRMQEFAVHFISQPPRPEIPGFQPFDLRINGVSYFKFNQLWKLGTPDMVVRGGDGGDGMGRRYEYHRQQQQQQQQQQPSSSDEGLSAEEQRLIAQAKLESLRDLARQQEQQKARQHHQQLQGHPEQPRSTVPALLSSQDRTYASVTGDNMTSPASRGRGGEAFDLISLDAPPPPSQVLVPAPVSGPSCYGAPQPDYARNSFTAQSDYGGYAASPPQSQPDYARRSSYTEGYGAAPAYQQPPPAYQQQQQQQQNQLTPYGGQPAPYYGGIPNNVYLAPPPAPAYPVTPSYGEQGAPVAAANPFASPSGQTEYSYGSPAPAFAQSPTSPTTGGYQFGGF